MADKILMPERLKAIINSRVKAKDFSRVTLSPFNAIF